MIAPLEVDAQTATSADSASRTRSLIVCAPSACLIAPSSRDRSPASPGETARHTNSMRPIFVPHLGSPQQRQHPVDEANRHSDAPPLTTTELSQTSLETGGNP